MYKACIVLYRIVNYFGYVFAMDVAQPGHWPWNSLGGVGENMVILAS